MGIPKKLAKEKTWLEWVIRIVAVSLGAFIMAFGLELFLIPNNVLDGGVVGVSIISSHFMNVPMGTLVFFINIPFIFIGYKQLGKTFTILTGIGIAVLSISSTYLHQFDAITDELLLATVYGGTLIGIGVGIAIKFGGCLDGSEVLAILLEQKNTTFRQPNDHHQHHHFRGCRICVFVGAGVAFASYVFHRFEVD